jgi:arylformamidase
MLTYANYRTAAEFDAGYANSIDAAVVDRWQTFFREESRKIAGRPRVELRYGPDPRNRIDFFPSPSARPGAPVLIAIHGGLWFLFDRWMMHFLVPAFTAAGIHVACPSYRLAPHAGLDEIVTDCRRAVSFLHLDRAAAGVDPRPFSVIGHSAAGQLAAVMASTDWQAFDPRLPSGLILSWIGVSGFYDIEPFELTGFQAETRFATDAYRRWNPVNLVRSGMPPGLLITGAEESGLLHEMMDGYAVLLRSSGVGVETRNAPGESHFSVLSRLGDPGSELHQLALAMVLRG